MTDRPQLDDIDVKILSELQKDGRVRNNELAARVGISEPPCLRRVRSMRTSGIIKAPVGSEAMGHAWEVCRTRDPQQLVWGETGPSLIAEAVRKYSLEQYAKSYQVFCPLGYLDWRRVLEPETHPAWAADSYAIHLWNEMWRGAGQDKNAGYPAGCLYEQLKRRYLNDGR